MPESLLTRKRDLLYLTHFSLAIPISFIVDLQPIYPPHLIPKWMLDIMDFYTSNWHNQFFLDPPPFFLSFIWSEALFQVPAMIWGWRALYKNSPKLPIVLLPFSCLIFITTAICIIEFWFWDMPRQGKINLTLLYGPYLALSGVMFVDMCFRLNTLVNRVITLDAALVTKKGL